MTNDFELRINRLTNALIGLLGSNTVPELEEMKTVLYIFPGITIAAIDALLSERNKPSCHNYSGPHYAPHPDL
jgi:hypothetical protein